VLAVLALLGVTFGLKSNHEVTFPTPYQAVLLANGAVYYAKVQGYGTSNPVLMDVFYIVTQTNPATKQTSNVLVKRGKERQSDRIRDARADRREWLRRGRRIVGIVARNEPICW
jgi:hypothetical protein